MIEYYTKDQFDSIANTIGSELQTVRASSSASAEDYDSFVDALDEALKGSLGMSCLPTSLEFIPRVTLPEGKDRIILRAKIEINGELTTNGTDYNNNRNYSYQDVRINKSNMNFYTDFEGSDFNTAEKLAKYLFLDYMGIQSLSGGLLKYEPKNFLDAGNPLSISGYTYEELDAEFGNRADKIVEKANIKLTLMLIDNLPLDGVDYVKEQWGEEQVVEGCGWYTSNYANA